MEEYGLRWSIMILCMSTMASERVPWVTDCGLWIHSAGVSVMHLSWQHERGRKGYVLSHCIYVELIKHRRSNDPYCVARLS